jgi:P27 family predicted phage terminase small subunit
MLCVTLNDWQKAQQAKDQTGLLYTDPNGQVRRNPLNMVTRDLVMVSLRLAQDFGLTPSARAMMGRNDQVPEDEAARLLS